MYRFLKRYFEQPFIFLKHSHKESSLKNTFETKKILIVGSTLIITYNNTIFFTAFQSRVPHHTQHAQHQRVPSLPGQGLTSQISRRSQRRIKQKTKPQQNQQKTKTLNHQKLLPPKQKQQTKPLPPKSRPLAKQLHPNSQRKCQILLW